MKNLICAIASLSLLSSASIVVAAEPRAEIPTQFRGEWNAERNQCGQPGSESMLWIQAKDLSFYESGGPARAIVTQGASDLAVIVESSGEGESWLAYHYFRLSDDRQSLTSVSDEFEFVRYRCP